MIYKKIITYLHKISPWTFNNLCLIQFSQCLPEITDSLDSVDCALGQMDVDCAVCADCALITHFIISHLCLRLSQGLLFFIFKPTFLFDAKKGVRVKVLALI